MPKQTKLVKTESGSLYEIDEANKKIRRIYGTVVPTAQFQTDGQWVKYESINKIRKHHSLVIIWALDKQLPATITTPIVDTDLEFS